MLSGDNHESFIKDHNQDVSVRMCPTHHYTANKWRQTGTSMLDNAAAMLDLPESMNDDGSATQLSKFVVAAIPICLVFSCLVDRTSPLRVGSQKLHHRKAWVALDYNINTNLSTGSHKSKLTN